MTQIATKSKKSNFSILSAYKFFAIQKRYEGISYKNISLRIKENYDIDVPESTIKWWFYKNGQLITIYREYADEMIELEREETKDFLKGNVSKAAKILAKVMLGNGSPAQVSAANIFLDRGLGKVKEEIEAHVKHTGVISVVDVLKLLEQQDL